MYNANFENKPVPGSVIKNCVRVIGTTTEICDEKIYPDPQVVTAAGSIVLSNATTEVNQYYSHDLYEFTIRAYDSNAIIIEEFTTLEYDPSVSSPSLAGAPAFIAANVNVVDGYNFTTTSPSGETFEGTLKVTQVYDAVNDAFDTTLQAFGDSYIYTIDDAAILEGTSLKVDTADIFPPPFGTFELTVYDSTGTPIIAFSEPHSNLPQNYPANSGSTYPLLPGVYNPSVNDGGTLYPVAPFCVEPWKICENTAKVNYNGLSASASFVYDLPVDVDQTNIQTQFETLVVPDQYILRDCTGAVIYDTGQIATNGTPDIQSLDVTAFDLSCGYVELETIPDPMAGPMTVTIFSLSVGCCEGGEACVLPERDPYVSRAIISYADGNPCGYTYVVNSPYITNNIYDNLAFREDVTKLDGPTCIDPFSDWLLTGFSGAIRPGPNFYTSDYNTCYNIGLPSNRQVTRVGNKVIVDFVDAASYNMFNTFFSDRMVEITAREAASGNCLSTFRFRVPQDVLCGDDGNTINETWFWFHSDIYTSDPVGGAFGAGQVCFDFDLPYCRGTANADPCLDDLWDPANGDEDEYLAGVAITALTYTSGTYNGLAATVGFNHWYGERMGIYTQSTTSKDITSDPDWHYWSNEMGFTLSSCANSNPIQAYTIRIATDNYEEWELLRGDIASNLISPDIIYASLDNVNIKRTVVGPSTHADNPTDGDFLISATTTYGDYKYNNIYIQNEDGLVITKNIDFPNLSFDLTYYGGGSAELFADWSSLANRISALTGITSTVIQELGLIGMGWNNFPEWVKITASSI